MDDETNESDDDEVVNRPEPPREHCVADFQYIFQTLKEFKHNDKRSRRRGGTPCRGTVREALFSSIVYDGIVATMNLKCGVCSSNVDIRASPPSLCPPLNDALVLGTVLNGQGLAHHQRLFSTINMKPMADKKYYAIEKKLQTTVKQACDDVVNDALEAEKAASPTMDDHSLISAGSDGAWFARGSKDGGFKSLGGFATLIGTCILLKHRARMSIN